MSLRRIAKLFAAQNAGQVVTMLSQILLPPAFLHVMGASLYGQWLTLSASVAYLSTLHCGPQTYANMQMAIHYNRGEVKECQEIQSGALRIMLGAMGLTTLVMALVFLLPISQWLNLSIPAREAQWTVYFLGIQLLVNMVLGFFCGSYLVFQEAHRGTHYGNIANLITLAVTLTLVLMREPFPVLAGVPAAVLVFFILWVMMDLARRCPDLRPTLSRWRPGLFKQIAKPSFEYTLITTTNLLSYQLPIILINKVLGPTMVTIYSISRTVYSMSRRVLAVISNSIGAEITTMYGGQDWKKLGVLYDLSERIVLLLTPPMAFGTMLATPLLLHIWLEHGKIHSLSIYHPGICLSLGLIISMLGIKEHKNQFLYSANEIVSLAWQTFATYSLMFLATLVLLPRFGIQGFLIPWLAAETFLVLYALHKTDALFGQNVKISHRPVYVVFAILAVCAGLVDWPLHHITSLPYFAQGAIAVLAGLALGVVCYKTFEVDALRKMLASKLAALMPSLFRRLNPKPL